MLASVGLGHARHVLDTHDALLKIPVVELLVAAKAEDFLMRQMSLDKILILVERNFTRFKLSSSHKQPGIEFFSRYF